MSNCLSWDKPMTSAQVSTYWLTNGVVAVELFDATQRRLDSAEAQVAQLQAERDDWKAKYELAARIAKKKQDERDAARYEAQMTAARMVADEAAKYEHIKGSTRNKYDAFCYSVLCELWSRVSGVKLT